jgi:predicted restriction endonuclease
MIHEYNKTCYKGDSLRKKNTNANKFRKTVEWKNKSEEIRQASKYLCAVCLDNKVYNYNQLEVHHIEPIEKNFSRRLDNYNLICLCNEHHRLAETASIDEKYLFELAERREKGKI